MRGGQNIEFQNVKKQIFSLLQKSLFSFSQLRNQYVENDKDHYYKSSWSLLQKSERRKEWKECWKSQFCQIFEFWLPMA